MLIQVLEESRRILDVFYIKLHDLHAKLFTFLLFYIFLFTFLSLFLFRFVSFFSFRCDLGQIL